MIPNWKFASGSTSQRRFSKMSGHQFHAQYGIGNTDVFSKNLAEQVSNEYKDRLPIVLFRPSVVVGALKEPLPGWIDNVNGPIGILLAFAVGVNKTMYCDPNNNLDMVPVDMCIKGIITAAWKKPNDPMGSVTVYNCALGDKCHKTIQHFVDMGISSICREMAMEHSFWKADGSVTLNKALNFSRLWFYQVIPAWMTDKFMEMQKTKPRFEYFTRAITF